MSDQTPLAPKVMTILGCQVDIESTAIREESRFHIKANICEKKFEWIVYDYQDTLDVTPLPNFFSSIIYDPYSVSLRNKVFGVPSIERNIYVLSKIIIEDLLDSQRGTLHTTENARLLLNIEMVNTMNNIIVLPCYEEKENTRHLSRVSLQFPLLHKSRLSSPELEYLIDVTENHPIQIIIHFLLTPQDFNSFTTECTLIFPSTMILSKTIHTSDNLPKWTSDMLISDYLLAVESKLTYSWSSRRGFMEELRRIAAVVEFDPVDFSFISIVLRQKLGKRYVVCTVEIRFSSSFPNTAPYLTIYDLQTTYSTPIDSNTVKYSSHWSTQRAAREIFLQSCELVHKQAFG
mmetsp:Transcript_5506/g.5684  ORF Transcript_5506/g.5684 Transcript_5506/m.5684 type:complete len:347 (+) Transcript_5506:213-1253(+)